MPVFLETRRQCELFQEQLWSPHYPHIVSRLQEIFASVSTHSLIKPNLDFIPRNPYKGLLAFTGKDSGDFFGREKLVEDRADALLPVQLSVLSGHHSTGLLVKKPIVNQNSIVSGVPPTMRS
jgi:hypothetical protein